MCKGKGQILCIHAVHIASTQDEEQLHFSRVEYFKINLFDYAELNT